MRFRRRPQHDETLRALEKELAVPELAPPAERIVELRAAAEAHRAAGASPSPSGARLSRRGLLVGGVGAAAGAAAGVGAYAVLDVEPPTVPTEAITLLGAPAAVVASAELINHTWGVELLLTISGLEAGRRYDVRYLATDDREVVAGSFVGVETEFLCRMTGALLREDTQAIELLDEDGGVVLRSTL